MYRWFLASLGVFHDATTLHLYFWPCLGRRAGRDLQSSLPTPAGLGSHALCIAPKAGVGPRNETHPSVYSACRRPRYASHLLPTILPHVKHLTGMIISALRLQRHKHRVRGCEATGHRGSGLRCPAPHAPAWRRLWGAGTRSRGLLGGERPAPIPPSSPDPARYLRGPASGSHRAAPPLPMAAGRHHRARRGETARLPAGPTRRAGGLNYHTPPCGN